MKKVIIMFLALAFVFASCDENTNAKLDPAKSKIKTDAAFASFSGVLKDIKDKTESQDCQEGQECKNTFEKASDLDVFNFTESYGLFNEAIEADPSNLDAQLGAAITRILALAQDPNFIKLRDAWWRFNDNEFVANSANLTKNRLNFSTFINESLKPAVKYSLERLKVIDTIENKNYIYTITPEFYHEPEGDAYELDMGEIKLFHAALIAVDASVNLVTAYKIDLADYSLQGIKTALTKGSDFLTLLSAANVVTAHTEAKSAVDKAIEAIDFILAEVDDQDDDLIRNTGNMGNDLLDAKDTLNKVKDALNSSYELKNRVTVTMDIPSFVSSPATDLKALLPDYTVTIENDKLKIEPVAKDSIELVFPDPTFAGLFPGLAQENMKLFFNIYECDQNVECEYSSDHCSDSFRCEYGAVCATDSDCGSYEHCVDTKYCDYGTRCNDNTDCESYETCNADNICE